MDYTVQDPFVWKIWYYYSQYQNSTVSSFPIYEHQKCTVTQNIPLFAYFIYKKKTWTFCFTEFLAHLTDQLYQKMKKFDVKCLSAFFWYLLLYSVLILHICIYYLTTNKRISGYYMYINIITNSVKYSGKCHEMKATIEIMGKGHFDQAFLFFDSSVFCFQNFK